MEAGTLVEWLVKPGDAVRRGDIVAVVETQKGAIEIETFESGAIEEILVGLGRKVPVGTALARIRTALGAEAPREGLAPSAAVPECSLVAAATPSPLPEAAAVGPASAPSTGDRVRASPAARRLAQERNADLLTISGTGPAGAVIRADVERSLGTAAGQNEPKRRIGLDLNAMRAAIATAMTRSKREIPHYYLTHQVDVSACEEWLRSTNAARAPDHRLLMGLLALKSVALAARRFPAFNGFYRDGRYTPSSAVHVGVAIAIRGGGLAAPALHDADQAPLDELMARLRDLVRRMRSGRIRGSEMAEATITVSSLGERGVEALHGIIYPPQVALVGFGTPVMRPWVVDGTIAARSVLTVTLAADHRVSDGHTGALFLAEIGKLLQEADKL
jgi:pyruvate dehydrogenase E2 component (dihydrolipoamide acetyltransferase)